MKKVITYGTYDLLHYGHIKLLERAKALGDYLIVGITSEDFDKSRGKINVKQSLMERFKAVEETGLADEIIVEEYEGQKIDDIFKYGIDVFTVGSDWEGTFDYLKEYCEVVYLPRTEGISSSELRTQKRKIKLGLIGESLYLNKMLIESKYVNGVDVTEVCFEDEANNHTDFFEEVHQNVNYEEMLEKIDAVYIISNPQKHYQQIKLALEKGKHVLCESPITLSKLQTNELFELAKNNKCILMEAIKTAYSTAYSRMRLLLKGGIIGKVVSVDATCTSLKDFDKANINLSNTWNSLEAWGPTALLPIFQILGLNYRNKLHVSSNIDLNNNFDLFSKIDFIYDNAVASIKVGSGVKSEGELIISGTKGYIYVPAPWWKTDYFEVRYEDQTRNRRYFYKLDGEGIRLELVSFVRSIEEGRINSNIDEKVSLEIGKIMEDYIKGNDLILI